MDHRLKLPNTPSRIDFKDRATQVLIDRVYGLEPIIRNDDKWSNGAFLTRRGNIDQQASVQFPWASGYDDELDAVLSRLTTRDEYLLRQTVDATRQEDMATHFGVSQPQICYGVEIAARRAAIVARAVALLGEEHETPESMDAVLMEHGVDNPIDRLITVAAYWTGEHQSAVADLTGLSQGFVRHRLLTAIRKVWDEPLGDALTAMHEYPGVARYSPWRGTEHAHGAHARQWCEARAFELAGVLVTT